MLGDIKSRFLILGNSRLLLGFLGATTFYLIVFSFTGHVKISVPSQLQRSRPPPSHKTNDAIFNAASNRTLGLDSIFFLNLPQRHDRFDAMAIQSYIADIQVKRFPAVNGSAIDDKGMPPMEKADLLPNEKGCFRAHANVWQHMLENRLPAVLVLEADAGFDAKLRPIMGRLNRAFRELLRKDNPHVAWDDSNTDDPWLARSGTWDYLSVGHCLDKRADNGSYVIYHDPDSSADRFEVDQIDPAALRPHHRVVYRADSVVCTAGYLVSLSGAAKLLVRSSLNLDSPIDLIIAAMTQGGNLKTYSQRQPLTPQWGYIPGIGKTGSDSDIHTNNNAEVGTKEGWDRLRKERTAVFDKGHAGMVDFALGNAWHHIIGE